jgi:hypothetical protein
MKKLSQLQWIYISLAGFILFTAFFYGIIRLRNKAELDGPVYFFLIVFIDLIATGFLAGAMKSVSMYQSSSSRGTLLLTGPIVVFCIILYIGYQYRPQEKMQILSLSVQLRDPTESKQMLNSGAVSIIIDLFQQTRKINEDGVATFTGINQQYSGQTINLLVDVPGYHLASKQGFRLSDSSSHTNLFLDLKKNVVVTAVLGRLISLPDKLGVPHATIHFAGTSKVTQTDSLGNFAVELPIKPGSELRIIASKGNKEIYNSLRNVYQNDFITLVEN